MKPSSALRSGIEADILIKVASLAENDASCGTRLAYAGARIFDQGSQFYQGGVGTFRPIYGYIVWCRFDVADFESDIVTAAHEVSHILVRVHMLVGSRTKPGCGHAAAVRPELSFRTGICCRIQSDPINIVFSGQLRSVV